MPFTQSNAPVRPVKEIQFGILSPEDIVRTIIRIRKGHVAEYPGDQHLFVVFRQY
jgi:hypothetical protein